MMFFLAICHDFDIFGGIPDVSLISNPIINEASRGKATAWAGDEVACVALTSIQQSEIREGNLTKRKYNLQAC